MTQDKFIRRNQLISAHLERIAEHRVESGGNVSPIPSNRAFRDLLIAQERLLLAAERMLDGHTAAIA